MPGKKKGKRPKHSRPLVVVRLPKGEKRNIRGDKNKGMNEERSKSLFGEKARIGQKKKPAIRYLPSGRKRPGVPQTFLEEVAEGRARLTKGTRERGATAGRERGTETVPKQSADKSKQVQNRGGPWSKKRGGPEKKQNCRYAPGGSGRQISKKKI